MAADGICDVMSTVEMMAYRLVFREADVQASWLCNVDYKRERPLTHSMTSVYTAFTDERA